MSLQQAHQRLLAASNLLPDFRDALVEVVTSSGSEPSRQALHRLPLDVFRALGGREEYAIQPFVTSWSLLYDAVLRLDHLQDDDPEELPLPTAPHVGASYNLVLALYVLANATLDDLDQQVIPPTRLLRLQRLWNDCVLTLASGQHRDLLSTEASIDTVPRLDYYQQLAHAKAGPLFALAFAGTAILVTDDDTIITACRFLGDVYGALLQLGDDLHDHKSQITYLGLTLHKAYAETADQLTVDHIVDDGAVWEYWKHVYAAYRANVDMVLSQINDAQFQTAMSRIFDAAFGRHT